MSFGPHFLLMETLADTGLPTYLYTYLHACTPARTCLPARWRKGGEGLGGHIDQQEQIRGGRMLHGASSPIQPMRNPFRGSKLKQSAQSARAFGGLVRHRRTERRLIWAEVVPPSVCVCVREGERESVCVCVVSLICNCHLSPFGNKSRDFATFHTWLIKLL